MADHNTPERFWTLVDVGGPDDCWPWKGALLKSGYGRYRFEGKQWRTHRLAMRLTGIPIPEDLFACHRCNNRACCNPMHLYAGTNADNMRDSVSHGTHANARRDECLRGHPFTPENTRLDPKTGWRHCRACARLRYSRTRALLDAGDALNVGPDTTGEGT